MLFHVLGHIDTDHISFGVEQGLGKCLCELGFADACRSEENERTDRSVFIFEACSCSEDCLRNRRNSFVLSDNSLMKNFRKLEKLFSFGLHKLAYRNARPRRNNLCDFFFVYFFFQKSCFAAVYIFCLLLFFFQLLFKFRKRSVFELCQFFEVVVSLRLFHLAFDFFNLLLGSLDFGNRFLFVFPLCSHGSILFFEGCQFFFKGCKSCCGSFVGFLAECLFFNLKLHNLSGYFVQFRRHAVDFGSDSCSRFVHQVDGLIRQESVADITVGKRCTCNQSTVRNSDAVMDFKTLFQASEDGNRIFHRRLIDQHLLESSFECGVFFDVFTIFIQGRSTDAVKLASCQFRLQEVARIHRAFGSACAHDIMNFIDEQNDSALGFFNFV